MNCGFSTEHKENETEPLCLVFGATGTQGGNVIKALIASKKGWKIRAVTRNPGSPGAQKLKEMGVEVVKGDQDDLDFKLFEGVTHCYLVTNYWAHLDTERERKQLVAAAKAIKKSKTMQFTVYSTLEDYTRNKAVQSMPDVENGYKVAHFDVKGQCDKLFNKKKTCFLRAAFYLENFLSSFGPNKNEDGSFTVCMPMGDKKLPMVAAADIGFAAATAFNNPAKYAGKYMGLSTCIHTGAEIAATMAKAYDLKVNYYAIDAASFSKFPFPGAADIANMFDAHRLDNEQFIISRTENSPLPKPKKNTFLNWLVENKAKMAWLPKA